MEESPLLHDPLTKASRNERRSLLIACAISFTLAETGLDIHKVLGAEFTITNQQRLPVVLAVFVGYFLVAFVTSAASDFTAWWSAYNAMKLNYLDDLRRTAEDEDVPPRVTRHTPPSIEANIQTREAPLLDRQYNLRSRYIPTAVRLRALFTFAIPVVVGLCTLGLLIYSVCAAPNGTAHR
jgi:hypothetical protein